MIIHHAIIFHFKFRNTFYQWLLAIFISKSTSQQQVRFILYLKLTGPSCIASTSVKALTCRKASSLAQQVSKTFLNPRIPISFPVFKGMPSIPCLVLHSRIVFQCITLNFRTLMIQKTSHNLHKFLSKNFRFLLPQDQYTDCSCFIVPCQAQHQQTYTNTQEPIFHLIIYVNLIFFL